MTDIIDTLAGIEAGSELAAVRDLRPQARENAQRSFAVLLEPADPAGVSLLERYAIAAYSVALQASGSPAADFYRELLAEEAGDDGERLASAVTQAAQRDRQRGPYGVYREPWHERESAPDPSVRYDDSSVPAGLPSRLAAALEHTHLLSLHPRDARPRHLRRLESAGWSADDIVTISQLISFLAFQVRVVDGLRALAGHPAPEEAQDAEDVSAAEATTPDGTAGGVDTASSGADDDAPPDSQVHEYPDLHRPQGFTQEGLGWVPWLTPVAQKNLNAAQRSALIDEFRIQSPYFRLLVRNADALEARTLTDKDIFYNTDGGLPRADREIAASAASRLNGCVYCASVHTSRATAESGRGHDVQRLLDEGVEADLGPRWNAVVSAAAALTTAPSELSARHIEALRDTDCEDAEIIDAINGAAFFNWANRLMLSLGEPEVPARRR